MNIFHIFLVGYKILKINNCFVTRAAVQKQLMLSSPLTFPVPILDEERKITNIFIFILIFEKPQKVLHIVVSQSDTTYFSSSDLSTLDFLLTDVTNMLSLARKCTPVKYKARQKAGFPIIT